MWYTESIYRLQGAIMPCEGDKSYGNTDKVSGTIGVWS